MYKVSQFVQHRFFVSQESVLTSDPLVPADPTSGATNPNRNPRSVLRRKHSTQYNVGWPCGGQKTFKKKRTLRCLLHGQLAPSKINITSQQALMFPCLFRSPLRNLFDHAHNVVFGSVRSLSAGPPIRRYTLVSMPFMSMAQCSLWWSLFFPCLGGKGGFLLWGGAGPGRTPSSSCTSRATSGGSSSDLSPRAEVR